LPADERESDENGADRSEDHSTARERPAHLAGREGAPDPEKDADREDRKFAASVAHHARRLRPISGQSRRPIMNY
jgi:hypothetical protein